MNDLRILFIINPKSGHHQKLNINDIITNHAEKFGYELSAYLMLDEHHPTEINKLIQLHQPKIIVAIGGDGTINLVADIIKGKEIALLIVPFGSANGMAKELNISENLEDCLNLIFEGKTVTIDLLKVNDDICVHLTDIGFNAKIVYRFQMDKNRGFIIYAKHFFLQLFTIKRRKFLIHYENQIKKVTAIALTFANANKYGIGAVINPDGKLNDGWFEICIIKPFPRWKIFSIAYQMFKGTLKASSYYEVIKCQKAMVFCNKESLLQIDGEISGRIKTIKLTCLPKALKVIIPANLHHPSIVD